MFKISVAELRQRYASGERYFKKVQLRGADLSLANLRGVDLSYADLREADLSYSDLRESILNGADLREANLKGANLNEANLKEANLKGANLKGVFLKRACLNGVNLSEACLEKAHLNGTFLTTANLNRASLSEANLIGAYLMRANLSEASLLGAWLNKANLTGANLSGAYYNDQTYFNNGFDPISAGMQKAKITIVKELLSTFNYISQCSNHYLGNTMTANYWKSSRPDFDWLNKFQINCSAEIAFSGALTESVSPVQLHWSQKWVNAFIKCCSQIIQDFPTLIDRERLVFAITTSDVTA